MKNLKGRTVRITSDNELYIPYLDKDLIITESYFQFDRDEDYIYDLDIVDSDLEFPFSLYKWEFEVIS